MITFNLWRILTLKIYFLSLSHRVTLQMKLWLHQILEHECNVLSHRTLSPNKQWYASFLSMELLMIKKYLQQVENVLYFVILPNTKERNHIMIDAFAAVTASLPTLISLSAHFPCFITAPLGNGNLSNMFWCWHVWECDCESPGERRLLGNVVTSALFNSRAGHWREPCITLSDGWEPHDGRVLP